MSLLKHQGFRCLWVAQTASQFGTYVSRVAVPLVATTALAATPFEMGLLYAVQSVAFLLIGLPAGVLVDRMAPRTVMVISDLVRAGLLLTVPLVWWLDWLTLSQLLVIGFLGGCATVFFDVAYLSYLVPLVGLAHLTEGNARLESSRTVAQVAGPAAGGVLADLLSAANAVGVQALCYLVSAFGLKQIREETPPPAVREREPMIAEIRTGLRYVLGDPFMRAITGCSATFNFFYAVASPLLVVLLVDELDQPQWAVGALMASGGIGGFVGATAAGKVSRWAGHARVIWLSLAACMPCGFLLPLSSGGWGQVLFVVPWFIVNCGLIIYNVAQVSFRQRICPPGMMSRMNATVRFLIWGVLPLGGLVGGALGEWAGVRLAVAVAVAGMALSAVWVLASPLRTMRDLPEPATSTSST
ncbi:MFS transporter [Streptomyces sp. NPDC057362]|uniref:MFS transporter n=1 Tax=Streptomyces sp. NPDC057362 TaxID=3346106 RepID=UPI003634E6FA